MKKVEFLKENCQDKPTVLLLLLLLLLFLFKSDKKIIYIYIKKPTNQALGVDVVVPRRMLTEIPAKNMKICRYSVQSTTKSR